jgi:hypothetical protein
MPRSLLIHDGSTPCLRTAADALTARADDLVPAAWGDPAVQAFLDAQFDARPFAFLLVEGSSVHAGEATVARLLERWGVDPAVAALLERLYPLVSAPFGRAVHGREPADLHGTFELTDAARDCLEPLRRAYEIPVETA